MFANIATGAMTDMMNNTIGCRQNHATMAQTAGNEYYCRFAALSGGGVCGTILNNVCDRIVNTLCMGNANIPAGWANNATQCQVDLGAQAAIFGGNQGQASASENSLECRLYHAEAAFLGVAPGAIHCAHTAASSATCTTAVQPIADQYCGLIETTCTGPMYQQYYTGATFDAPTHYKSCTGSIAGFNVGPGVAAANNNDLSSRVYHVSVNANAGGNTAGGHCAHAGPSGGLTLGGAASARLGWLNISANPTCMAAPNKYIYAQIAEAMADWPTQLFSVVPPSANIATYSVGIADVAAIPGNNTDACRIYHMSAAASGLVGHCVHGSITGGGVCGDPSWAACQMIITGCPTTYSSIGACQAAIGPYFNPANPKLGNPCGILQTPMVVPADDTIACRLFYATTALMAVAKNQTAMSNVCMNAAVAGAVGCNVSAIMAPTSDAASLSVFGGLAFLALLW
jgi:hypothetical protein